MSTLPTQLEAWLAAAIRDAERRGLPELKPLLETMARSTAALRAADTESHAATNSTQGTEPRTL